jgi:hypothetical protein
LKRWLALLATAIILAAVLIAGRGKGPPATHQPAANSTISPEQCIERMFDAAERGDVDAYLDCFTGPQRQQIERELTSQTRQSFSQSLVDAIKPLKGRAMIGSPPAEPAANQVELTVERIYANRNETQTYQLLRQSDAWRITAVRSADAFQPPITYGTPVFELPPEPEAQ